MYFQIEKIILWSKKIQFTYRTVDFCPEKINVITGASQTGKSAIIPIIDYCLGEGNCRIPVNTIRDACSWFGVIIKLKDKRFLLARREPEQYKSADDMMLIEGEEDIEIPKIPMKNITRQDALRYLNEMSRISFLKINPEETVGFNERPSFRDMMAFCYQTQNIVANANTLFYKADTTEHRNKLINIFPYILGAITPEILAKRQDLNILERQLKRKERELNKMQEVADKWKIEIAGWINAAKEFGLISADYPVESLSLDRQMSLLKEISEKSVEAVSVRKENIEEASKEIIELRRKEEALSMELSKYKSRYFEMTQFVESIEEYRKTLVVQVDKLEVSKWLKELSDKNEICPFCGEKHNVSEQLGKLVGDMEILEKEAEIYEKVPAAFEREYALVEGKISELTEKINALHKSIIIQNGMREKNSSEKYTLINISRFLGKIQYAEETYRAIAYDGDLQDEIRNLKDKIERLRKEVDVVAIERKIKAALKNIELKVMKLLPYSDAENPEDNIEIDYKNLTISVTGKAGRKDYLWEIGSGSNWLSYHLTVSLAFQMFFSEQTHSPVPQFIVYDQPSQVYFPNKLAQRQEKMEKDPLLGDEDIMAVKKIFETMSKSLKKTNSPIQIIVLEHAPESAWQGVENINLVEEWRGENNKLIPEEWL